MTLTIPATCSAGHELTPRTTHVRTATVRGSNKAVGWECLRCLRASCYKAHWGQDVEVPDDVLDDAAFRRQPRPKGEGTWPRLGEPGSTPGGAPAWWTRVVFTSGWQFTDPDARTTRRA